MVNYFAIAICLNCLLTVLTLLTMSTFDLGKSFAQKKNVNDFFPVGGAGLRFLNSDIGQTISSCYKCLELWFIKREVWPKLAVVLLFWVTGVHLCVPVTQNQLTAG